MSRGDRDEVDGGGGGNGVGDGDHGGDEVGTEPGGGGGRRRVARSTGDVGRREPNEADSEAGSLSAVVVHNEDGGGNCASRRFPSSTTLTFLGRCAQLWRGITRQNGRRAGHIARHAPTPTSLAATRGFSRPVTHYPLPSQKFNKIQ